jgi:hypothetical protein
MNYPYDGILFINKKTKILINAITWKSFENIMSSGSGKSKELILSVPIHMKCTEQGKPWTRELEGNGNCPKGNKFVLSDEDLA